MFWCGMCVFLVFVTKLYLSLFVVETMLLCAFHHEPKSGEILQIYRTCFVRCFVFLQNRENTRQLIIQETRILKSDQQTYLARTITTLAMIFPQQQKENSDKVKKTLMKQQEDKVTFSNEKSLLPIYIFCSFDFCYRSLVLMTYMVGALYIYISYM
jgi:hypothetical protein